VYCEEKLRKLLCVENTPVLRNLEKETPPEQATPLKRVCVEASRKAKP